MKNLKNDIDLMVALTTKQNYNLTYQNNQNSNFLNDKLNRVALSNILNFVDIDL